MAQYKKRSDGRYQTKIYDAESGKYKYLYAKSVAELKKKELDLRTKISKGIDLSSADDTFSQWLERLKKVKETELTENCRAALWYSQDIEILDSKPHGIKALRECADVKIVNCSIISPEFGWSVDKICMENTHVTGEYFMMRSSNLDFKDVELHGKYSFQYIENAVFENCVLDTKDAFWHGKNITVRNSIVKGEYLAWYSENGILPHEDGGGRNGTLILTEETKGSGIDTRHVDKLIQDILL